MRQKWNMMNRIKIMAIIILCFILEVMHSQTLGNDIRELTMNVSISKLAKLSDVDKKTIRLYLVDSIKPEYITVSKLAIQLNAYVLKDIDDEYRIIPRAEQLWVITVRYLDMVEFDFCIPAETKLEAKLKSVPAALRIRHAQVLFTDVLGKMKNPIRRI